MKEENEKVKKTLSEGSREQLTNNTDLKQIADKMSIEIKEMRKNKDILETIKDLELRIKELAENNNELENTILSKKEENENYSQIGRAHV